MANDDHIALVKKGVDAWNAWREKNRDIKPKLGGANLKGENLSGADLTEANLQGALLAGANLKDALLSGANLTGANLRNANLQGTLLPRANLRGANLEGANLRFAYLREAELGGADLRGAELRRANLSRMNFRVRRDQQKLMMANFSGADLSEADLSEARLGGTDLRGADLRRANLNDANLRRADLSGANLESSTMVNTDLAGANLTGCHMYGISAWSLKLKRAKQQNLIITPENESEITVDNIEVAQFIYLLLHNEKIRDVIDTLTTKAVLILGRFTDERKAVLDALREELRKHDYVPILFDFAVSTRRDITETVSLLARMARFIIADLTDPSSIPKELEAIVPHLAVPVQPLLEGSSRPYAMFKDYWKYEWVLPVCLYEGLEPLLATLAERIIVPAEAKVKALEERRRMIEAELTKASP
jgi:uncharacterized protein YjbI with pentapeptide repeats